MKTQARIAIFYTGGTISMTKSEEEGGAVPTLSSDDIRQSVPQLDAAFDVKHFDFSRHPGPHMTIERVLALHKAIIETFAEGFDGVVVAHGTDTLEESAYLCDLIHEDPRPIVFVGAMRTREELSWDGPVNLFSACLVASAPESRGHGVMVVMNNSINAASEVTKTFTESLDTFVTPEGGPLGMIDVNVVMYNRYPRHRMTLEGPHCAAKVMLLNASMGCDGELVDAAVAAGASGIVIEAMGRGNVPPLMAKSIEAAIRCGVAVVIVSRCWGGRVAPIYAYLGGGARLARAGAIFAPWHNGPKARLALAIALGSGYSLKRLQEFFGAPPLSAPVVGLMVEKRSDSDVLTAIAGERAHEKDELA